MMLELARAPQDHSWDRESDVPGVETSLDSPSILKRYLLPQTIAGTAGEFLADGELFFARNPNLMPRSAPLTMSCKAARGGLGVDGLAEEYLRWKCHRYHSTSKPPSYRRVFAEIASCLPENRIRFRKFEKSTENNLKSLKLFLKLPHVRRLCLLSLLTSERRTRSECWTYLSSRHQGASGRKLQMI